jgi:hypothetical protein
MRLMQLRMLKLQRRILRLMQLLLMLRWRISTRSKQRFML